MAGRTLILLSCSRDKLPHGNPLDAAGRSLASSAGLPTWSKDLLAKRKLIFDGLCGQGGRLYDEDQQGGFRDERRPNRALVLGPDFGGNATDGLYLPAHERYTGRFFEALNSEAPDFWVRLPMCVEVLFVSGLYGLVFWNEQIQEYDCHLNDLIKRHPQPRTVADFWKATLSKVVCEFLRTEDHVGRPIRQIYDLLSEESYQEVFDWNLIASKGRVRVHHRIFRPLSGRDTLPCIAQILASRLRRFCEGPDQFRRGKWIKCSDEEGSLDEFGFEFPIGQVHGAAREGDAQEVREWILKHHSQVRTLATEILDDLVLAELSWQKIQRLKSFDYGCLIVSYAKPVERWLTWMVMGVVPENAVRLTYARPESQARRVASERRKPPRLQELLNAVREKHHWAALAPSIEELWDLRGKGAHASKQRTRDDLTTARSLAFNILEVGEAIRSQRP
jgi:hypothetical protein